MSSLYLEHFRLSEPPFGLTPNGRFFFEGSARRAILEALQHAVLDDDGIIVVVGEVGSGKTMLCRVLADRLPRDKVELVYLANPSFGPGEILYSLLADWGLQAPAGKPPLLVIQEALMERHAQGMHVVVLIDEAQAMSPESLDEIKLLSNLETSQRKLLQIVLFGQPELDQLLALPRLRQVRDRVVHRFDLTPLNDDDACAYVYHRLRRAGWQGGALFESKALLQLVKASHGRARAIHLLADKALLAAFAQGAQQVSASHVQRAIADFKLLAAPERLAVGPRGAAALWSGHGLLLGVAAVGALLVLGMGLGYVLSKTQRPNPVALVSQTPNSPSVPAVTGVVTPAAVLAPAVSAPAPDAAAAPTPNPAPVETSAPSAAASPAVSVAVSAPPAAPAAPAVASDAPTGVSASDDLANRYALLPAALRDGVLRTRQVFDNTAEDGWTVQIGIATDVPAAMRLLNSLKTQAPVWVHDRQYANQQTPSWAVYAGLYASRNEAAQAVPEFVNVAAKAGRPMVRSLQRIRTETYPERAPS